MVSFYNSVSACPSTSHILNIIIKMLMMLMVMVVMIMMKTEQYHY